MGIIFILHGCLQLSHAGLGLPLLAASQLPQFFCLFTTNDWLVLVDMWHGLYEERLVV